MRMRTKATFLLVLALALAGAIPVAAAEITDEELLPCAEGTVSGVVTAVDPDTQTVIVDTGEGLCTVTLSGERSGTISNAERGMIERVLDLTETSCARVMVPRQRAVTVRADTPAERVLAVARQHGYTRLPVLARDGAEVVGVVSLFDLLAGTPATGSTASDCMRTPELIAAETPVGEALVRMRHARQPMLMVTQRGRVVGLVTVEDVLARIVRGI